jgi:hypothetical protein
VIAGQVVRPIAKQRAGISDPLAKCTKYHETFWPLVFPWCTSAALVVGGSANCPLPESDKLARINLCVRILMVHFQS